MKDAYWFKHDSNASRDLKLMQIKAIYGLEGIGMFWSVIEVLREQKNYSWEESQLDIFSKIIDADSTRFSNFIADCKRIELLKSNDGLIFSQRLMDDMAFYESKKQSGKLGGLAKSKQKHSNHLANGVANSLAKSYKESKGEESKGELEEIENELKNVLWLEQVGINIYASGVEQMKRLSSQFFREQELADMLRGRPLNDIKSHFMKWAKIQLKNAPKEKTW